MKNKKRYPTEFQLHELVLMRATPYDRLKYAHYTGDHRHKLIPKWSLPHRVVTVYPGKKKALVKDLLTGECRHVQIQNVRFIQPPKSAHQREEWERIVLKAADTMFDPKIRNDVFEKFWEQIDYPQLSVDVDTPHAKRRRM
jgi:hypothetical protein